MQEFPLQACTLAGYVARVACLHHLERPFTGHAGVALRQAGIALAEHDLRRGDPLPELSEIDGIISYGGEQSVTEAERHPYLQREEEFLCEAVERRVPVFGICLGGQLLAHALGGEVRRMPRRTVAWEPLEPLPAAEGDPAFGDLPSASRALHWNEDAFEAPIGAVELLARRGDGVEAFRWGDRAWGIQFHPEVNAAIVDEWYRNYEDWLAEARVSEFAMRAADERWMPGQPVLSRALFGGFARVVIEAAAARVPRVS
jgi:GMP synthase (glutamine-hydrolysing)